MWPKNINLEIGDAKMDVYAYEASSLLSRLMFNQCHRKRATEAFKVSIIAPISWVRTLRIRENNFLELPK